MERIRAYKNDSLTEKDLLFKEIALMDFRTIRESRSALDQKIHNMILLCISVITVILGVLYFVLEKILVISRYPNAVIILVILTLTFLLVSLCVGLWSYLPKSIALIITSKMIKEYSEKEYLETLQKFNDTLSKINDENREITITLKERLTLITTLIIFALSFLTLVLIVIMMSYIVGF